MMEDEWVSLAQLLTKVERSRTRWMIAAVVGWIVAAWFVWASLGEIGRV